MIVTTDNQYTYIIKYNISVNHTIRSFQTQSDCEKLQHVNSMGGEKKIYTVHSHFWTCGLWQFTHATATNMSI